MHLPPRVATDGFYRIDLGILAAGALLVFLVAIELGFRFGRGAPSHHTEPGRSNLSTLQAAVLTLLALLLGFSFAMAQGRYDARRQLVVQESNAIGTTFLRTALLAEPERTELRALLRHYVDARLAFH